MPSKVLPALAAGLLVATGCHASDDSPRETSPVTTAAAETTWDLDDPLDSFRSDLWTLSDGYTNGPSFNCGWRADRAHFERGIMSLGIDSAPCPASCSGKPFAAAELASRRQFGYGRLKGRLKVAKGIGIVTSLFFYDRTSQDEIDVEILGKDPTKLQTNYYTGGVGEHATLLDLGFDASTDFHTYAIDWSPEAIRWYVDDRLVHAETGDRGPLPTHPAFLMANFWPGHGSGTESWLGGAYPDPGTPVTAQYDFIRYRATR